MKDGIDLADFRRQFSLNTLQKRVEPRPVQACERAIVTIVVVHGCIHVDIERKVQIERARFTHIVEARTRNPYRHDLRNLERRAIESNAQEVAIEGDIRHVMLACNRGQQLGALRRKYKQLRVLSLCQGPHARSSGSSEVSKQRVQTIHRAGHPQTNRRRRLLTKNQTEADRSSFETPRFRAHFAVTSIFFRRVRLSPVA